jgi:hypothetical protein
MDVPNIKFHGNLCGGSRAETCGRTDRQTETVNMTKAIYGFRVNLNDPKNTGRITAYSTLLQEPVRSIRDEYGILSLPSGSD